MSELVIRAARPDDAEKIIEIDQASFAQPWSAATMQSALQKAAQGEYIAFIAEKEGAICGFVIAWTIFDEAEIGTLAVAESARGQGIARRLLEAALEACQRRGAMQIFLEVRPGNTAARRLYESCGFQTVAVRKHYYKDGDDAIIMKWEEKK